MKKIATLLRCLTLVLLCTVGVVQAQPVTLTESFDGTTFLPAGWTSAPAGSAINFWTRSTAGTFPTTTTHSGAGMARYNSRTSTAGTMQTIATPPFGLANIGTDTARVSLWVYRNDTLPNAYDTLNIMVNTVNDTNGAVIIGTIARSRTIALPDTQAAPGWYQYTFDIPASFNGNTNYILFRGVTRSGGGNGYRIFIDDVSWDTYPVDCNGAPTAGVIHSTDTVICNGSGSVTLSLSGVDAGVNGITYQWQSSTTPGGPYTDFGTGTLSQNSGTLSSTTYFVCKATCTTTGDSSFTAEFTVSVNSSPLPTLVTTPAAANHCVGAPAVLLTVAGAHNYTWFPQTALGGASLNGDSIYANPTISTTYTITGYDTLGCHDTISVRVSNRNNPTVTVSPLNGTVCSGDSITLTATASGTGGGGGTTVTYTWQPGGSTGNSLTIYPTADVSYTVTGVTNYGCSNNNSIDTSNITVSPLATAAFTYSYSGDTTFFTNSSANAVSYSWNFGNGDTSSLLDPSYIYGASGVYYVTLVATNGCNSNSVTDTLNVIINGIATLNNGNLRIFPIPAKDVLNIDTRETVRSIELLDISGRRLSITNTAGQALRSFPVSLAGLQPGVYFVRINSGGQQQTVRFVHE